MIECIITMDYEIYGDGRGALMDLVYRPTQRLTDLFQRLRKPLVLFVEVCELEMMEAAVADPSVALVKQQVRRCYESGVEIGLHMHPWWYTARYQGGAWYMDFADYNLCGVPEKRMGQVLDRSLSYLRHLVGSDYSPLAFRAGHLLFQPSGTLARALAERGLKVDSSVYKGGVWHAHGLDYRPALRNPYYWKFAEDAATADSSGVLFEIPVYTVPVRPWTMLTKKRVGLHTAGSPTSRTARSLTTRARKFLRWSYPLKLDICHMTRSEMRRVIDTLRRADQEEPSSFKPIVAIGHTKDLKDLDTVEWFLSALSTNGIPVSGFREVHAKLASI